MTDSFLNLDDLFLLLYTDINVQFWLRNISLILIVNKTLPYDSNRLPYMYVRMSKSRHHVTAALWVWTHGRVCQSLPGEDDAHTLWTDKNRRHSCVKGA